MIRLKGRRVSADVRAYVRWIETVIDVRHDVDVFVVGFVYGFFDAPGRRSGFGPYIVVAANDGMLDTIAHELVHYEQWRDGRDMNERGVNQRAAALVRRWHREGR